MLFILSRPQCVNEPLPVPWATRSREYPPTLSCQYRPVTLLRNAGVAIT